MNGCFISINNGTTALSKMPCEKSQVKIVSSMFSMQKDIPYMVSSVSPTTEVEENGNFSDGY